ncbi:MAG: hypothetical protein GQ574_07760 [Crocinitomix sp.]|nr:hypothetical protein [Crocinitomix sp.]
MEDKRLALLIGVSDYDYASKLKNPVNDVHSMSDVLSKLGFTVIKLTDLSYREFKQSINQFGKDLNQYKIGLFYFAGHGMQVDGVNYLIPKDANPLTEKQVEYDCINANMILSIMEGALNETNFVILDACRNNPFKRSWTRSPSRQGLSYMSAPYGTLIAYSTAPDKTASDGDGENGLYTSVLLKEILSPTSSIIQVLQNVRSTVINLSNKEQVPWESTSLIGDFHFNDNKYFSIATFCESVMYNDKDQILNNLNLDIWSMTKISESGLSIAKEDVEMGVIEVYIKNDCNLFNIFSGLEYKLYKNGEREYILYTSTNNAEDVIIFSNDLLLQLGEGLYDDERNSSFREHGKIKKIAKGKTKNYADECFSGWIFDDTSFWLKYLIEPKKQLQFTIKYKPTKKVIKKTILELLKNDYDTLREISEFIDQEEHENAVIKNYRMQLPHNEFGFFDTVEFKIRHSKEDESINTNFFLKKRNFQIEDLSNMVGQISSIYGKDESNSGYLSGWEVDNILTERYWSGRSWHLNIQHQILDMDSNGENIMYSILINYDPDDCGLEFGILGYENITKYNLTIQSQNSTE